MSLTILASLGTSSAQTVPMSTVPEVRTSGNGVPPQPQVQTTRTETVDYKMTIGGGSSESSTTSTTTTTGGEVIVQSRPKIPNSIAVTDFSVKREYKDFFYDEKANAKSALNENSSLGPIGSGQPSADGSPQKPLIYSGNTPATANTEFNYSKSFGTRRAISYSEIRGINADIKAAIIKAGYKVVQAAPNIAKDQQGDDFFDIRGRINRGDFGDAQYVLHGTIVNVDVRQTYDQIPGTSDYSYRLEYSLLAEFSLVNTETLEIIASFNASGSGQDMYLGKYNANFVPRINKITKELLVSFGQAAQKSLYDQLLPLNKISGGSGFFGGSNQSQAPGVGDPSTLKVYRPSKNNNTGKEPNSDIPLTIYRK